MSDIVPLKNLTFVFRTPPPMPPPPPPPVVLQPKLGSPPLLEVARSHTPFDTHT